MTGCVLNSCVSPALGDQSIIVFVTYPDWIKIIKNQPPICRGTTDCLLKPTNSRNPYHLAGINKLAYMTYNVIAFTHQ